MSPVAKEDAMLRMLESDHDLTWILAASGWPRRQVEAFAHNNGYRFGERGPAVKTGRDPDTTNLPVVAQKADVRVFRIPVNTLKSNPNNPRERFTDIDELAASIKSVGMIQPIVVRRDNNRFIIIAGHRRHAAVQLLGWHQVDVILREADAGDDLLTALIENGQRAGLDPIEEARAMNILKQRMGLSDKAIAHKVGMSQPVVSGRLALLALPAHEQEAIRRGEMNMGDAIPRARIAAGTARAKNSTGHPHLGIDHDLAARAKVRCLRMEHKKKGRNSVGGVACGQCWEETIRADERQSQHATGAKSGECPTCGGVYGTEPVEATG